MPQETMAFRFLATGDTEFRFSYKQPKLGDTLKRNGDEWVVVDVRVDADGNTVVTLRPLDGTA